MKLLTYIQDGMEKVGVLYGSNNILCLTGENGFDFKDMNDLIKRMTDEDKSEIEAIIKEKNGIELRTEDVKIIAPVPHPEQDVICLGINYAAHAEESERYRKEDFATDRKYPIYFSKRVNRASGDGDIIPSHSDIIKTLDYESELAVIIGKEVKDVKKEDAHKYIFGYTIMNDVTARELQSRHKQWYYGKSLDGFTPMGPVIITADEIPYPPVLEIKSYVNGELRQNSRTDLFIHDIDYVISELTEGMTLLPGTIISTGTPAGVGMGFDPPRFLKAGDTVTCEIEKIGKITNKVL